MKKTLIALAVAASAAVSGSAMAWSNGDFNGSVDIGGTVTPPQFPRGSGKWGHLLQVWIPHGIDFQLQMKQPLRLIQLNHL